MKKKLLGLIIFCLTPILTAYAAQTVVPLIMSFSPASGAPGTLVTITGSGLESPASFTIGGKAAIVISNTGTQLVGMVMPGALTGIVSVTTAGGTANGTSNFTVTATPYPVAQQGNKLVGNDNIGAAQQGTSVSVSADGNTAIIGGYLDNSNQGAAWVYTRNGSSWTQQGNKLVGMGAVGAALQGCSVSLSADGNTAIIGGRGDNFDQGAAWVFTRTAGVWSQQGDKLVGTGGMGTPGQGISVSLSADGHTAIVGGYLDRNNINQGSAWIFTRSGNTWSQQGNKLVGTGNTGPSLHGTSVALSADGNTAIVGGPSDNFDNSGSLAIGAAWVYTRSGNTWSQQGSKLVGTGNTGAARQGISVSLSADGNTAMVGGDYDNSNQGAAWVFTRSGDTWIQQGTKLVGTGALGNAQQGRSVSLSADGNTAIVGGDLDNTSQGATWVYTRSGGAWTQRGTKLTGIGNMSHSLQGGSISLSADGTSAIVGGRMDNSFQGAAWIFTVAPLPTSSPPPPIITDFTATGTVGSTITITGNNFNTTPASNIVFFGATRATVSAATTTSLTVTVPSGATYSPISVTNLANNLTGYSLKPFTPTAVFAGTQSFETKRDYTAGSQPYSIDAGDLDGDGRSDLVVTNSGSNNISIYRNLSQDSLLFSAKSDLATGGTPQKVIFFDLDGDGKKDIITGNVSGQSISIFKNTSVSGAITFNPKIDMITGASAQALAVGDLDGDGKPEIVVGYSGTQISVYRNSTTGGNISFSSKTDLTIGLQAKSIAIGDIDGDNVPDLAILTSNSTTSTVSVLRNTSSIGNLTFGTKIDFQAGYPPLVFTVAIGDLDGDGKFDLIVGSSALSLLRNTSSGGNITMAPKVDFLTGVPYSVAIGDLDGDGKPDLATGNANNINGSVSVLRNKSVPGTLQFQSELFSTGTNTSAFSIVMTDLDGDGRADLATANNQGMNANKMSILRNFDLIIPPPPVITALSASSGIAGTSIEITGIRFNSNAALNIVKFGAVRAEVTAATDSSLIVKVPSGATYSPVSVLNSATGLAGYSSKYFSLSFFPSKSTFIGLDLAPAVGFIAGTNPYDITISDFDNDGKTDIAVPNLSSNTVSVFRNTSSPGSITNTSFTAKTDFATGTTPNAIITSDLNGDGKTDIITSNSNGVSLSILRNTYSPGSQLSSYFAPKFDVPSGGSTGALTAGDLNMDGKPDLVFLNGGVPNVYILTNKIQNGIISTTSFNTKISLVTGSSPNAIAVGDLDGDGKPELAVTNGTSNTVSIFYNISIPASISGPSFAAKVDLPTGLYPSSVVIADLNGDGKPELIVGNMSGSSISVFRNISVPGTITNTSFSPKQDINLVAGPRSLTVSDINGDGKPDLTAILFNNLGSILRNTSVSQSTVSFAPSLNFSGGSGADAVAGGDLDGDGKPDLVIANQGGISVIRNNVNTRPLAVTGTPQSVGVNTALITGSANDNGLTTKVSFEYSLSQDLRDSISVPASIDSIAAGSGLKPVSVELTGLIPGKNYYYRIKGQNASGLTYGVIRDFTTLTERIIIPKPVISYVQNAYNFPTGIAIPALNPSNSGGAVPPADYLKTSTVAGNGVSGYADGVGQNALFEAPTGMVTDGQGNLFVSDQLNNRIRKIILASGEVSTLAGSGLPQFADGAGISASFDLPAGITIDAAGNLYVADLGNHRIRKIVIATGEVTTLAGSVFGYLDGIGIAAKFNGPWGLSTDRAGNLYVADQDNNRIRKIVIASGLVSTVAGATAGFSNGFATGARFNYPTSIIPDLEGNAFVTDLNNQRIRKINLVTKAVSTLAGDSTAAFADGIGAAAKFNTPYDVAADGNGNLYIADQDNHRIRKIVIASGEVSTLAGNETVGFADSTGTHAVFNSPNGITYDGAGNLYVSEHGNNRIRKISLTGYTISPSLPQGLRFNGKTGLISGIPLAETPVTEYLITAYNAGGADTVTITIGIIPASTNANLSALTINNGNLLPVFLPETIAYTASVSNETGSIRITPTLDDPTATLKVNGISVTNGNVSENIHLTVGSNTITTVITAQDSTSTKTYTLVVTRAASSNADLSALALSTGPLSPVFTSGTTAYTAAVLNTTTSVTIIPTVAEANATIKVNGNTVVSGSPSGNIILNEGANIITTIGTAQDSSSTKTYTLTINRAASTDKKDKKDKMKDLANAGLAALSLNTGTLSPSFKSKTTSYTASVNNSITSVTITPTVDYATATVKVNGNSVNSGSPSGNIALTVGSNTITTVVTAKDGTTTNTYAVTVTRDISLLLLAQAGKASSVAFIQGTGFSNAQSTTPNVPEDYNALNATNILSPNGDGKNDTWVIRNLDMYSNNTVKIYDRNGKEVYVKKNYSNDWDGTFQGSPLGEGTYYYIVDFGTGHSQLKGFVSIVR